MFGPTVLQALVGAGVGVLLASQVAVLPARKHSESTVVVKSYAMITACLLLGIKPAYCPFQSHLKVLKCPTTT